MRAAHIPNGFTMPLGGKIGSAKKETVMADLIYAGLGAGLILLMALYAFAIACLLLVVWRPRR